MGRHQRQHERFAINLEGTFGSGSFICTNTILNISLGGLCMECGKYIEPEQEVTVTIPTCPLIKVTGMVAWCNKNGLSYKIGIKFQQPSQEQRRAIIELISSFYWLDQARKQ